MKKTLIAAVAVLVFAACNKEVAPTLDLSTSNVEFTAEGGSVTIDVKSNTFWTVSTETAAWYTVTPTYGNGDGTVTVTAKQHTDAQIRSSKLTFEAESLIKTVALIQNKPALPDEVQVFSYELRPSAQELSIDAPSNYTYVVVPQTENDAIRIKGGMSDKINIQIDENDTDEIRTAVYSVQTTDGNELMNITITQDWKPIKTGELLIEEIFFTGNLISGSNNSDSGDGDQYFILTNNGDDTIYADGLLIAASETNSQVTATGAYYVYPDTPDEIGVSTMYRIPGDGDDVKIEAGKSIIIALAAQNFKSENGSGFDLSKADFEVYDENDRYPDTDNPDVKNLENWFKYSLTITTLHNRGYESYAIAIAPKGMTAEKFMEEHIWEGKKTMDFRGFHFERDITGAYLIPNTWVLDAVNCATEQNLGTLAFNAKVDAGYTNVTMTYDDPERYGKSVIRKKKDGKLVDTNNSTNDFEMTTSPSMK